MVSYFLKLLVLATLVVTLTVVTVIIGFWVLFSVLLLYLGPIGSLATIFLLFTILVILLLHFGHKCRKPCPFAGRAKKTGPDKGDEGLDFWLQSLVKSLSVQDFSRILKDKPLAVSVVSFLAGALLSFKPDWLFGLFKHWQKTQKR